MCFFIFFSTSTLVCVRSLEPHQRGSYWWQRPGAAFQAKLGVKGEEKRFAIASQPAPSPGHQSRLKAETRCHRAAAARDPRRWGRAAGIGKGEGNGETAPVSSKRHLPGGSRLPLSPATSPGSAPRGAPRHSRAPGCGARAAGSERRPLPSPSLPPPPPLPPTVRQLHGAGAAQGPGEAVELLHGSLHPRSRRRQPPPCRRRRRRPAALSPWRRCRCRRPGCPGRCRPPTLCACGAGRGTQGNGGAGRAEGLRGGWRCGGVR